MHDMSLVLPLLYIVANIKSYLTVILSMLCLLNQVAVADCAAEGLTPSITWINGPRLRKGTSGLGLTRILPEWTATYEHPVSMPVRPSGISQFFVSNAPVAIGIAETSFKIIFPNDSG
jgi:hypothetical protein